MSYPAATRRFLETRSLGPGEVKVRIHKGEILLYAKIGYAHGEKVFVEYMGERYEAIKEGQHWRLDVSKIKEGTEG